MRYIEIDGETYDVPCCNNCPCYDGGDNRYGECCKHPEGDGVCAECGGDWCDDPSERYGPNCPLRRAKRNSIVYAVFVESGEFYGDDRLIGLFKHREDAQKCVDAQSYPNWYYVKDLKVE